MSILDIHSQISVLIRGFFLYPSDGVCDGIAQNFPPEGAGLYRQFQLGVCVTQSRKQEFPS